MSYDDDEYHSPELNDYDDNDGFIQFQPRESYVDDSSASTLSTNRKKQRRNNAEMKKIDKGYHKVTLGNKNKFEVEVYSTNDNPGTLIRDAFTGSRYTEFRVGSIDEHQFFKTRLTCGTSNSESSTLFFDSPEQFERLFKTTVSQVDKEKWTNKCAQIRAIQAARTK